MATVRSQDAICRIVKDGILELETEAGRKHLYNGVVLFDDMLLVVDFSEWNFQVYNRHDGKLITSHELEFNPMDVCLINKTEVAVCLLDGIVIVSLKSTDDVKLVRTLQTAFYRCYSLAKLNSDKFVISGKIGDSYKEYYDSVLWWGIVSITDGHLDSIHDICKGGETHMAVKDSTVYISCRSYGDFITNGVYAYDIFNPHTHKFLYQHQKLKDPGSVMADRDCVYVCDMYSNRIHQLTDSGQLVTIHTVSSNPYGIFYDDQHGLLYTTSYRSNVITVYKMESLHQPDSVIPAEVLKMDKKSLDMYKEALNEGKEKVYNIRVMVVGQYGVGKTTLTQRLLEKNVNISERHSTDGIDVHVESSKVSLSTGEWTTQDKSAEKYSRLQRLVKLLNDRVQKQASEGKQERRVEMVDMVTSKEPDYGDPQHDHLVSAEHNISQEFKPPTFQPVQSPISRVDPESSSETGAKKNEKDTVMEILQLVNENSGKLENNMVEYAAVGLWDFAGQYVFYTTHQTFLTSRAIYLLVIDLSQQITDLIQDDECFLDMEGLKLCKVHAKLVRDQSLSIKRAVIVKQLSVALEVHTAVVMTTFALEVQTAVVLANVALEVQTAVVMATVALEVQTAIKFRQEVILEYFLKIREMLKNKPFVLHLMDSIAIDNTQCDPKLEDLKRRILELASEQPYWGEEKPARWIPLEQTIMTLKVSGVKVVPLSLIEEINRSASVRIKDRDELELFLSFQHEIGTILYFSAEGLREKIVLDPQWMIDALRSLITAQIFIMQNPAIIKKWYAFKRKGKLTHELIDAMWTKKEKPDFHDNKEYIILAMVKLNIIARPMSYTEDGMLVKEEDYFLAPCMLRQATPKGVICPKSDPENESTAVLCYVCKGKFLPTPIFHRLVGACLTQWPIAKKRSENQIYCGCCVFHLDHHHRLTLHFFGHVIFARATGRGVTDSSQSSKLCTEARKFIFENLLKITRNLGQTLQFEMHIQCPNCDADSTEGLFAVPLLQKHEKVVCDSHDESHTLVSQNLLRLWFEDEEKTVIEGIREGNESKVSKKGEIDSMDGVLSTSIQKGNTDIQDQILPQAHDVRAETKSFPSKLYQSKGVPCSDPKLLCQILQKSQQAGSSSQSTLQANCLSVGLVLYGETSADGNCFFEAVSSQLRRLNCVVQKSPQQLRQEVVAFMKTNRVIQASEGTIDLDSFIYNESFDVYCSRMARDSEWADHVVVVAMARMLQMDIMIVTSSPSSGPENIILWVVGKTAFQEDPILLGHVWESHYMSLQPIAPVVIEQELPGQSTQAQTDVTTPVPSDEIIQIPASGSTSSTAVGLIQTLTTGATPFITPTTAEVMPTATTDCIQTELMQASAFGSTTAVMQAPTSVHTSTNVLLATTSVSTPSTATGSTPCPKPTLTTAVVMQDPSSGSTTTDIMQALASGSKEATTTGSIPCPSSTPTAANVMQAPTSASTTDIMQSPSSSSTTIAMLAPASGSTAYIMQASSSGSKQSTNTGSTPCPTSISIAANVTQAPTSASTTDIMQSPSHSSTTNAMLASASGSTAANVMQSPTSASTATDILQSTASSSIPSTTGGFMPILSCCYTAGGLLQPRASSSIPASTGDVTQISSVDDTDRFMHIACLLVNVGSKVLRRLLLFHTVTPTCTLDQYLAKNRIVIDNLRKRKILNKSQMAILFPPGGSTNLGDYDISLLSALFTNIVPNISQQQLNMIQSLRDKRNEIFAHANLVSVNLNDYQIFWNDICRTLEALSKQCNDPDFENEISREIQGIQVSTVQSTSLLDTHQTHPRRIETLERLVQYLLSSHTQELNKESDDSDS